MSVDIMRIATTNNVSALLRILKKYPETEKDINNLIQCDCRQLEELLKAKSISSELIGYAAEQEDSIMLSRVIKLINYGFPFGNEVLEISKSLEKSRIVCEARDFVLRSEIFDIFKPGMHEGEMDEILKGMKQGIVKKRVLFYADSKFDALQKRELRKAFKHGISDENVITIANTMFPGPMMREMRKGYESGLGTTYVSIYAQDFFDVFQMYNIRKVIEGKFSPEMICFIANPSYSSTTMELIRIGFESGFSIEQVESYANLPLKEMREKLMELQMEEVNKIIA